MGWRKGNSLQFDAAKSGHISGMRVFQELEVNAYLFGDSGLQLSILRRRSFGSSNRFGFYMNYDSEQKGHPEEPQSPHGPCNTIHPY